ncbi:MAG: polyprenyl synthetase [Crocinitomicaceae bacterium]|nr:polyprenyl synthetase [Crocinitomicaceae bacterium]|tara:strand:- start:75869 stop:76840 length:972 start_codon:yes stop_codon:yes gene_type:complete
MTSTKKIISPINSEIKEFEVRFHSSMKSKVPMLDKITHYIIKRKGKQLRPIFILLTAKMLGNINDKTYDSAILVELLHTASLIHDDIVDDANERRGFFSTNALWKNKIAVLVGDYMLSKVLLLSLEKDNQELLKVIAKTVKEMSEGELLQIEKARKLDINEEIYFDIIRQKTGSLISTCCELGALSVNRIDEHANMSKFGELIGIAFQLKDDIFDYGKPDEIGKPTGIDIREQKITLPLIYVLNNAPKKIKRELINIIKNHNENPNRVKNAINLVIEHGGIEYTYSKMIEYKEKALNLIKDLPNSEAKESIIELVEYTTTRKK